VILSSNIPPRPSERPFKTASYRPKSPFLQRCCHLFRWILLESQGSAVDSFLFFRNIQRPLILASNHARSRFLHGSLAVRRPRPSLQLRKRCSPLPFLCMHKVSESSRFSDCILCLSLTGRGELHHFFRLSTSLTPNSIIYLVPKNQRLSPTLTTG
jgi:hypothetical protein